jgi:LuxR family transcriptional regulator, maltose regulon positive regulatory protein
MREAVRHGPAATDRVGRPALPPGVSWRSRLAEVLDAGTRRTATLICAGPGWGKTSLAASWSRARAGTSRIAWVTCVEEHNEGSLFWSDVLVALRIRDVADPGPEVLMHRGAGPVVLVLDDLHKITEPRLLSGLAGLLGRPPDWLHLLLISRTEPDLPLHRLRSAGELTELRARELAVRSDEAVELLAMLHRSMPLGELAALVRDTEGWAAGLRLALDAPPGVGPDDAVAGYLIYEVFAAEPPEVRDFLLRTSVPDRICGPLAEALTARQSSELLLRQLGRANLFLEPVSSGHWFRYHRQFRATLRHLLGAERPATVNRLHLLAAQWHSRDGSPLAALRHAATAGDWAFVARLVAEHGVTLFVSPDRAELVDVLRRIPLRRLPESAELVLCEALLTYELGDVGGVPKQIGRARALLPDRTGPFGRALELALDLIEAVAVFRWRGDMPRLAGTATAVLAELGRLRWSQVPAMPQYRAVALLNKGVALLWLDRPDRADRYLWAAATAARATGASLIEINALGLLALLGLLRGLLPEAREHAVAAIGIARRIDVQSRIVTAPAYLAQAMIEMEQGREVAAEAALRHALHASGEQPEVTVLVLTAAVRAQLLVNRGEPEDARSVLGKAVDEAGPALTAPLWHRLLGLTLSEIELAQSDPRRVIARYAHRRGLYPPEQLRLAEALQTAGRPAEAEDLLAVVREGPDRVAAVAAWVLTALAADARGHQTTAAEALTRAASAAEPDGIKRPFRRSGAERVSVLAEHRQWLTDQWGTSGEEMLAEITGELPVIEAPSAGPLSEREIDVLQFLPTVLTAGEIAEILGISVNTVKAHLRSIYRKLGSSRRREAVVTARQLGLL